MLIDADNAPIAAVGAKGILLRVAVAQSNRAFTANMNASGASPIQRVRLLSD